MWIDLPELESDENLQELFSLLQSEEDSNQTQDNKVDVRVAQIILRREGEDRDSYNQRVDRFISYIRFLNETSYLDLEIERLQNLKKSRKNLARRLGDLILYRLEISNVKKIETAKYKISVVGKGGKQPVEIDYDETEDIDLIPEEYVSTKVTKKIDKEAVTQSLKAGVHLTWARLQERGNRLSIK